MKNGTRTSTSTEQLMMLNYSYISCSSDLSEEVLTQRKYILEWENSDSKLSTFDRGIFFKVLILIQNKSQVMFIVLKPRQSIHFILLFLKKF